MPEQLRKFAEELRARARTKEAQRLVKCAHVVLAARGLGLLNKALGEKNAR